MAPFSLAAFRLLLTFFNSSSLYPFLALFYGPFFIVYLSRLHFSFCLRFIILLIDPLCFPSFYLLYAIFYCRVAPSALVVFWKLLCPFFCEPDIRANFIGKSILCVWDKEIEGETECFDASCSGVSYATTFPPFVGTHLWYHELASYCIKTISVPIFINLFRRHRMMCTHPETQLPQLQTTKLSGLCKHSNCVADSCISLVDLQLQ